MDSYEAYKNPKHINRIDAYINYADPAVVADAQESYVKMLVGEKGTLGHQFTPEQFGNIQENKMILEKMMFVGDADIVANDPAKMQVAINDFYINNSILNRGVEIPGNDLFIGRKSFKELGSGNGWWSSKGKWTESCNTWR